MCIGLEAISTSILRSAAFSIYASHLLCCPKGFDLERFSIQLFHVSLVTNDSQKY